MKCYLQYLLFVFYCLFGFKTANSQDFKEISKQSKLSSISNINGIAVADYDQDYDLDIFFVTRWDGNANQSKPSQLFRNNNDGTFTNVTTESGINSNHDYTGIPVPGIYGFGEKMAASWGDFNNDGYPDLLLVNAFYIELYRNNQNGTLSNVTKEAGFESNSCYNTNALWFDFNNDSFLDIYISSVFNCNGSFYINNGNGTFSDYTESAGLSSSGFFSWMAIPWDINKDGFQDLYISKDFDLPNEFFLNNGSTFYEDQATERNLTDIGRDGMGLAVSDYNNDGNFDLFITNINESSLYQNDGTDHFNNVSAALGIEETGWSWGCRFEDFDHDLDEDLVLVNGYSRNESNFYFENLLELGTEAFINRANDFGMDEPSSALGLSTFDYDNDGDLDVLISRSNDEVEFFENNTVDLDSSHNRNWIQIKLVGTASNRDAVGSVVKIYLGDTELVRYHHGAVLLAQNQQAVHFGLAAYSIVDSLSIKWPSGLTENYVNIPANNYLEVTEGSGYEIIQLNAHKIQGCTDPNSCNYNPDATEDDGSCLYLEGGFLDGSTSAGILSKQVYTYSGTQTGSTYNWDVVNGRIIEGQGTNKITIQWEIATDGIVSVSEVKDCMSQPVDLFVTLNSNDLSENLSVARLWNEALLQAIREDYARPTVHARNLFHSSVAMYDAWALYDEQASTYLIGKQVHKYFNHFDGFQTESEKSEAVKATISFAMYRLMLHRFKNSPHAIQTKQRIDELMNLLGYDINFASTEYQTGNPAALGNFIANSVIDYGLTDGSNEINKYANVYYHPVNEPLLPVLPGNPNLSDPNRWQPLQLEIFIDQAGNPIPENTPEFLSPEWGNVNPFALNEYEVKNYKREDSDYLVYLDPGTPPYMNEKNISGENLDLYKWNFSLVSVWSSHLSPDDGVMWDISPASIGNINLESLPENVEDHATFYNFFDGGDIGRGRNLNPFTGRAYEPQVVPRGDYTRVLAEFWADGPDSETPPGHWFTILNYIGEHPELPIKYKGEGEVLDKLEWDVKAYFTLGGALHDVAIASWSIKGWYDFIRPISAIRYMADQGQSSNTESENYNADGIPLIDGFIELVKDSDSLAGMNNQNVGKIKIYAWQGHNYLKNPQTDEAGVGWILAENWWPYQRPSFVTPPFAGYVSGHSTYSRAAAEVLTLFTGNEYFPGGLGEFVAKKNEFLVFEEGPSQDIKLQWATYRDASDQCSLSRIWGGIHPPCDDIPGRLLGAHIGVEAFLFAEKYFSQNSSVNPSYLSKSVAYPVPTSGELHISHTVAGQKFSAFDLNGREMPIEFRFNPATKTTTIHFVNARSGICFLRSGSEFWKIIVK